MVSTHTCKMKKQHTHTNLHVPYCVWLILDEWVTVQLPTLDHASCQSMYVLQLLSSVVRLLGPDLLFKGGHVSY